MCNLYSLTASQAAIAAALSDDGTVIEDYPGNLPPLTEIYPDQGAPVVRAGEAGWQIVPARWGLPSPAFALRGKRVDRGVTNVRNTASPHWRRWLGVEHRCLVPLTAFAEPGGTGRAPVWFALGPDRPLAFFAGIWTRWTSVRKLAEGEVTADLYGFLTCPPNREVAAVHPKAMPVILTRAEEWRAWLTAPWPEAAPLQRPLPDGELDRLS